MLLLFSGRGELARFSLWSDCATRERDEKCEAARKSFQFERKMKGRRLINHAQWQQNGGKTLALVCRPLCARLPLGHSSQAPLSVSFSFSLFLAPSSLGNTSSGGQSAAVKSGQCATSESRRQQSGVQSGRGNAEKEREPLCCELHAEAQI